MIKNKDLYIFGDMIYFAIETDVEILYYKTKIYRVNMTWLHGELTQGPWKNEIEFSSIMEDDVKKLSRGDYYNEIKKGITEYCNYEAMQRLQEEIIEELIKGNRSYLRDLIKRSK